MQRCIWHHCIFDRYQKDSCASLAHATHKREFDIPSESFPAQSKDWVVLLRKSPCIAKRLNEVWVSILSNTFMAQKPI